MSLADDPLFIDLAQRVTNQAELNAALVMELERNTKTTQQIDDKLDRMRADTQEIITAFKSVKASFELLETLSKGAKVLIPLFMVAGYVTLAGEATWHKVKSWLH